MSKAIVKLFRDPGHAARAVADLLAKGFKSEEIGILVKAEVGLELAGKLGKDPARRQLAGVGAMIALGPLAQDEEAPLKAIELPDDVLGYYEMGLRLGGVLLSVHSQKREGEARRLLLRAEVTPGEKAEGGFPRAERMTATDPVDARMTGDFRRY